jgi:hypothetical protein
MVSELSTFQRKKKTFEPLSGGYKIWALKTKKTCYLDLLVA